MPTTGHRCPQPTLLPGKVADRTPDRFPSPYFLPALVSTVPLCYPEQRTERSPVVKRDRKVNGMQTLGLDQAFPPRGSGSWPTASCTASSTPTTPKLPAPRSTRSSGSSRSWRRDDRCDLRPAPGSASVRTRSCSRHRDCGPRLRARATTRSPCALAGPLRSRRPRARSMATTSLSTLASSRRSRVAVDIPPATPPMITTRLVRSAVPLSAVALGVFTPASPPSSTSGTPRSAAWREPPRSGPGNVQRAVRRGAPAPREHRSPSTMDDRTSGMSLFCTYALGYHSADG